jgi:hypothetical protein
MNAIGKQQFSQCDLSCCVIVESPILVLYVNLGFCVPLFIQRSLWFVSVRYICQPNAEEEEIDEEIENGKHCRCRKQKIEKSRRSQEKGEKPQGYLPTLEAKVNNFFKKKKRENEPISNVDLKRKYVLMKKKKGRKERRRR